MNFIEIEKLAESLHRANSGVPFWCRRSFYGAKSFLLSTLGTQDGRDIQRIDYPCWRCGGSGQTGSFGDDYDCGKCSGTGVFDSRLVWLDRFKLGPYSFHCPVNGVVFQPGVKATITGKISHKSFPDSAIHASDLAVLFNREAFLSEVSFFCESPIVWSQIENLCGIGVEIARKAIRDKRLESARAWKEECEKRTEWCPF